MVIMKSFPSRIFRATRLLSLACGTVAIFISGNARADALLAAQPNGGSGFSISAGYYSTWGSVGFTPSQNYNFTSVTLWLTGFDGSDDSQPVLSLWSNNSFPGSTSQPGTKLLDFATPTPNDGSLSAFSFDASISYNLQANTTYWLVLSESGPHAYPFSGTCNWVGGATPSGNAVYNGSKILYNGSGFQSWPMTPAFSIGSANSLGQVNPVPEPSTLMLGTLMAMLLIISRGIHHPRLRGQIIKVQEVARQRRFSGN